MNIFYSDTFVLPLPEGHRFPIRKYALLRERVAASSLIAPENLCIPEAATDADILRAHTPGYLERVRNGTLSEKEQRRIGLPWSPQLVERSRRAVGATLAVSRTALEDGCAVSLAGGTHHAFADHGEGYCVFNDCVIAARTLIAEGRIRRAAIVDCDVHQGNGSAAILADDPAIFTFSIHGAKNYPFHKEQSDLDIALDDATDDETYLAALAPALRETFERARPDLVLYLAGADPFVDDALGRLALSKDGLAERDRMVLDYCRAAGVPIGITMAGGYARNILDTVDIHFQTVQIALGR